MYEIVENLGEMQLKATIDGVVWTVPPDLDNKHYKEFLQWNAEQEEPLELPEDWPILD